MEVVIERLIDELQRTAHSHGRTVRFQNSRIARVDADARADGRLRHIHRSDVRGLQVRERRFQFLLEFAQEIFARAGGGARIAFAADENDG